MNNFYELFDNGLVRIALVGVLSILALFLLAQTITTAADFGRSGIPATDTITVRGDGQAVLPPDVAHITFTVQNRAAQVADAQAATTKQTNDALAFVKKQGIADTDVKTTFYSVSPEYTYPKCVEGYCPGTPRVTGYVVSHGVQITVRKLEQVGDLIAGIGQLGVQNLSGPDFALEDMSAGNNAARADAIAKAKAQASELAAQLGVRLGKIVNFSETSNIGYPMAYGMGGGASDKAAAPVPSVPTGQNTYTASVSITYEIR